MPRITKIEQKMKIEKCSEKMRVAAYCRVSTDSADQLLSLEAQQIHYKKYIKSHEEWEYAGVYYDTGITGTKKEKRPALLQLIAECENGNVNYIITKAISRFARNTTDCLELVRKLLALDVCIYFEKENINTGDMESELMLSILSSLAENESVSLSQNSKWAIKKRYEDGTFIVSTPTYGYENINGKMVLNAEESKIVKFMFEQILAGASTHQIAKTLNQQGNRTKKGGQWYSNTICSILINEKYTGDILFQKTYTDEQFNRHPNHGEVGQYYMKNHHVAIVTHEDFHKAKRVLEQHCKDKNIEVGNSKYVNRYSFTKKIICGECGGSFKRRIHSSGKRYVAWCCNTHLKEKEKCSMQYIRNDDVEIAFITMMNKLIFARNQVLKPLLMSLRTGHPETYIQELEALEMRIEECGQRNQELQMLMSRGYLQPAAYNVERNALKLELDEVKKKKERLSYMMNHELTAEGAVEKLYKFAQKAEPLLEFDSNLFEEYVEKIVVLSRTELEFHLQCGLVLKERM